MEQRLLEAEQQQLRIVVPSEISQSNDENDGKTYKDDDDDSVDEKDYFVIVCYSSVRIYRERAIKQRKNVST